MDEPACGKTIQVCEALLRLNATALIICPKNVKEKNGWKQTLLERGTYEAKDIQVIRSSNDIINWTKRCVIVNPELALRPTIRTQLQFTLFDVLVVDEGHIAKNCNSKIAQKILSVRHGKPFIACANRTWGVSGTPTPNGRPLELFPWLSSLASECLGRYTTQQLFGDHYCGGDAMSYTGATNKEELAIALQPFILARRLRDVEPDVPGVTWENVYIDIGELKEDESNTEKATLRKLISLAAAPFVGGFINQLRTEIPGQRVVCFSFHTEAIRIICELTGGKPFWGGQSDKQRDEHLAWFEANDLPLVVQYTAGGTALDGLQHLTNVVVFGEPDYVPDLQAIRRIERIGQCNPIRAFRCLADQSMHRKMTSTQHRKKQNILEIIHTMARAKSTSAATLGTLEQFFSDITSIADSLAMLANDKEAAIPSPKPAPTATANTPATTASPATDATGDATAQAVANIPEIPATDAAPTLEDVRSEAKAVLLRFPTASGGEAAVNAFFVATFGKNKTSELDPSTYASAIAGLKAIQPVAAAAAGNDI